MPAPEIQQFRDLMAAKADAKVLVMAALGRARLAEARGDNATPEWEIVEEQGIHGVEGERLAEAQALADSFVSTHPELFAHLEEFANPEGQEMIVKMIDLWRAEGMDALATAAAMFELARFKRQNIGGRVLAEMRIPGGKT